MELLYVEEHLSCHMYDNQNDSLIRHLEKERGEKTSFKNTHNQLLFMLKGKVEFSFENHVNQVFEAGTFLLLPRESDCVIKAKEKSELVIVRMHHKINFCDHFPLTMLSEYNKSRRVALTTSLHSLKTNATINDWLRSVVNSVSAGLKCAYFQELRQKEVLYYLRALYSKEDLYAFFLPILNGDAVFSNLIYQHYEFVKNVEELANITNYSLSGFSKKFAKVFDMSPAVWMRRAKAKKIYHEINCTVKSFNEIAGEYGFTSPAHFDRFCRVMYNMSPGALRRSTKNRVLLKNKTKPRILAGRHPVDSKNKPKQ